MASIASYGCCPVHWASLRNARPGSKKVALSCCHEVLLMFKILLTAAFNCSSLCCYSKPETSDVLHLMTASERACRLPRPENISQIHYKVYVRVKAQHCG